MFSTYPSLLSKIRRHRGLWSLAFVVLLLKLVSGTVCLADGAASSWKASPSAAVVLTAEEPSLALSDDACLLGEGTECHCACVHSVALPTMASYALSPVAPQFVPPALSDMRLAAPPGALHRPPIA
ncbi:MAG: hypothetical protein ACTHNM_13025 [Dyella sp.]|uniref:hypothetical protein n=1 Tax=Dyella sp. TaxID=1869338 RepID=UPI003F7FCA82